MVNFMSGAEKEESTKACDSHTHTHPHKPVQPEENSTPAPRAVHAQETVLARVVGFMDIAGVFASTLCMIHCLLLPIVVAVMPFVAKPLMKHDWVHAGLAGFVLTFCLIAYIPGYLQHRDKRLIYVGVVGLTLVFFATFVARAWGEIIEAVIITAGNTVIIFGHMLNRKKLAHLKCRHKH